MKRYGILLVILFIGSIALNCGDGIGTLNGVVIYNGIGEKMPIAFYNIKRLSRDNWGTSISITGDESDNEEGESSPFRFNRSLFRVGYIISIYITPNPNDANWFPTPPPSRDETNLRPIPTDIITGGINSQFSLNIVGGTYYAYAVYDADGDGYFSSGDLISVYNNKSWDADTFDSIHISNDEITENFIFTLNECELTPYILPEEIPSDYLSEECP